MKEEFNNWMAGLIGSDVNDSFLFVLFSGVLIFFGSVVLYMLAKQVLQYTSRKIIKKSASKLNDVFAGQGIFARMAYLMPTWFIHELTPVALAAYPFLSALITAAAAISLVFIAALLVGSLIDSFAKVYHSYPLSQQIPIQSFAQVAKLITYFFAFVLITSILLGESPLALIAGMGAMTAVLMLVFKDSILGFVAGLQLSLNRMLRLGDWVEIPQHNADGDILEIGLTTVKVRNFDNTVTTVPTQSLVSESFKNWRGMQESTGRRIKRAIHIDANSVNFCDRRTLKRYSKIDYIKDYIGAKQKEIDQFNEQNVHDAESIVNGRRLTNIGTFRAYIKAYLENNPDINKNLTLLVRQLAPGEAGIPLEIYAFSSDKNWARYETIQADIFDHLYAVAKEFDLRVFQKPSGSDFQNINSV